MRSLFGLLLLICNFPQGFAQQYVDLINIGYSQNFDTDYRDTDDQLQHRGAWARVKAPLQLNEQKDFLIASLNYSSAYFQHSFYPDDQLSLHDLELDIGYLKNWKNPSLSSYTSFGGGIASDFSRLREGAFNFNSTFLLIYKKREGLSWRLGLNVRKEAFGVIVSPLLGINWTIRPRLYCSFLSFSHLQLEYQHSSRLGLGLRLQNAAFSFTAAGFPGIDNSVLHTYFGRFPYIPQRAFLYTDVYLTKSLVTFGRFGLEFSKELVHEEVSNEDNRNSAYNGVVAPNLFFDFGIAWRIRL